MKWNQKERQTRALQRPAEPACELTESIAVEGASLSAGPPALLAGELLCHRFRVVRGLGQGGMAQVFEAYDEELERAVAIKVIRPELADSPAILERFKREARLSQRVTHDNVCRVFDFFQHRVRRGRALAFLSMEMIPGETLSQRLGRSGPLSPLEAAPLLCAVAEGLWAAHRVGVVHGDLKPSNLMLGEHGGALRPVITDFGLAARVDDSRPTRASRLQFGTAAYMAPEYAAEGRASKKADLFSFGLLAFKTLTGRRFDPEDSRAGVARLPLLPGREALACCLASDPEQRPSSAGQLALALAVRAELDPLKTMRRSATLLDREVLQLDRDSPKVSGRLSTAIVAMSPLRPASCQR